MSVEIEIEQMADEIARDPGYYGLSVFRRNPCCYGDKIEVSGSVLRPHYEDASTAIVQNRVQARAIEMIIERGAVETIQGACEGCEVTVGA